MAGTPSNRPSSAPPTVPEYVTSSPTFQPLLMPETRRSGSRPPRTSAMAMLTQSAGVPSTAWTSGSISRSRNGRDSVSACPMALASPTGAQTTTRPSGASAAART